MKYLVLTIALILGGCASFSNPVSQTQIYQLENAYGVAQTAAVAYTRLPRCVPPDTALCSQYNVIVKLAAADQTARTTLQDAETFIRANPTLSATSVISAAQAALRLLQQIETQYGVR